MIGNLDIKWKTAFISWIMLIIYPIIIAAGNITIYFLDFRVSFP